MNVLFAEYRGYGASTGTPALGAMLDDAVTILAASGEPPENVVLFGRSIGSLFAIELAARYPNVRGLILESGIADPLERTLFRVSPEELSVSHAEFAAAIAARLDHRTKLGRYVGPLLVLHAAGDSLVVPSHAERNFEWAAAPPGDKELALLPRGNHNSIFLSNYDEYTRALRRFLARLGERAPIAGVAADGVRRYRRLRYGFTLRAFQQIRNLQAPGPRRQVCRVHVRAAHSQYCDDVTPLRVGDETAVAIP